MLSPAVLDICRGRRSITCEWLHRVLTIPRVEGVDGVGRMIKRRPEYMAKPAEYVAIEANQFLSFIDDDDDDTLYLC